MEMQAVDLYSGDIPSRSDTIRQTEVEAEHEEYRPSSPCHSHQTRAQLLKKFPFRCATCNNKFPTKSQLENHLVKHPNHSTMDHFQPSIVPESPRKKQHPELNPETEFGLPNMVIKPIP
ncbi:hypothetical protein NA56DRAFT_355634 [Hyaloscypha hepaticicola]|uniref:C2H2-type domain-containing protein n=1 Tax=Hyaloscypha hepaticicola TaxID=2082293 RepID=A0A2J6PLY3_9HELO|nr:hypothetical protein NA56DRAFT_355634 [Hyaloscypha hepaticicola]